MAVYRGNVVPYGSGGHWYVQVVVTDGGSQIGPSTPVTYTYQVVFENSVVDSTNTINWSDPWGSGSANNTSFNGAGTYTIAQATSNATIVYGGGNSLHFRMYATGMATGGTGPSVVEFDHPLPGRAGSVPDPPVVTVGNITANGAGVWVAQPGDEHGLPADVVNYRIHRQFDGAWMGDISGPYAGVFYGNLDRVTGYTAYAQTHNALGWSGWSAGFPFVTKAQLPGKPAPGRATNVKATSTTLQWVDPDNGGILIRSRAYQYSLYPDFLGAALISVPISGVVTRDDLLPGRTYYWRYRVANDLGVGEWSDYTAVRTQAGAWITIDGKPKLAVPYVNDNGTWKLAVPYVKVSSDSWKPVNG